MVARWSASPRSCSTLAATKNPAVLKANAGKSFIGSIVLGMGFTFDDDNPDATPLAEMERLIAKDPRNAERIFPYIGGEEVNDSPTHAHHRYVINFGELSEEEAWQWPDLMAIVEAKVKPERLRDNRESYKRHWWWTPGGSVGAARRCRDPREIWRALRDRRRTCATLVKATGPSLRSISRSLYAGPATAWCFSRA